MNESLNKINMIRRFQNIIMNNYKLTIGVISIIFLIFIVFQLYFYIQSKKILNNSILFNQIISDKNSNEYESEITKLSNDKTFYGVLATLENIKIKLNNNEIGSAYKNYLFLLNNKKLNNIYKSSIAIQASYNLLNKIDIVELKKNDDLFSSTIIYEQINKLLFFIDDDNESFEGHKLEITFLLYTLEQQLNGNSFKRKGAQNVYTNIQQSDNISSAIKERVKKIYDFQKYK